MRIESMPKRIKITKSVWDGKKKRVTFFTRKKGKDNECPTCGNMMSAKTAYSLALETHRKLCPQIDEEKLAEWLFKENPAHSRATARKAAKEAIEYAKRK